MTTLAKSNIPMDAEITDLSKLVRFLFCYSSLLVVDVMNKTYYNTDNHDNSGQDEYSDGC
jgi:hypothetical protein